MPALTTSGVLGLISLLAALTSGGIGIGKAVKQSTDESEAEAIERANMDKEKKASQDARRQQRRESLARVLGLKTRFVPQQKEIELQELPERDYSDFDIAQGISNVVGQTASAIDSKYGGSSGQNLTDERVEKPGYKYETDLNVDKTPGTEAYASFDPNKNKYGKYLRQYS